MGAPGHADVVAVGTAPFTLAGKIPTMPDIVSRAMAALLDGALGLRELQRLYRRTAASGLPFVERALAALDLHVAVTLTGTPLPERGPLLLVANHPRGMADGLAILSMAQRVRPDVKVLANELLTPIPALRDLVIPVSPFGTVAERASNARGLRGALAWLAQGGCLVTFPAGEVAHELAEPGIALDGPWHPHIAALATRSRAAVVPIFVGGANSRLFRAAGALHPLVRTALLPRELLNLRGGVVRLVVGVPVDERTLASVPAADRTQYLRSRTYVLAPRVPVPVSVTQSEAVGAQIVPPVPPDALAHDVAGLPADSRLASIGGLEVYCARAAALPHVLPEIGRLREETFRAAGEGTGRPIDLDRFDATYWHLFAWDPARSRVVGAYRLGATDEIVSRAGAGGLYTNTLFHYDVRLLEEIGPALELGRSFVRQEYQRGFAPLLALWTGVGRFVARHPRYRRLLGAVSISSRYDSMSRQLLVRFLTTAAARPASARLVRPRRPLPSRPTDERLLRATAVTSLESVSALVRAIERDGKPIPVLLRQYLNLNAKLLAFSLDPDFGDAVDGLMLADLTEVPRPMLYRLMGREEAERFLACHQSVAAVPSTRRWRMWARRPATA